MLILWSLVQCDYSTWLETSGLTYIINNNDVTTQSGIMTSVWAYAIPYNLLILIAAGYDRCHGISAISAGFSGCKKCACHQYKVRVNSQYMTYSYIALVRKKTVRVSLRIKMLFWSFWLYFSPKIILVLIELVLANVCFEPQMWSCRV